MINRRINLGDKEKPVMYMLNGQTVGIIQYSSIYRGYVFVSSQVAVLSTQLDKYRDVISKAQVDLLTIENTDIKTFFDVCLRENEQ